MFRGEFMKSIGRIFLALSSLALLGVPALAERYTLPLFETSTASDAATGVVRILNATDESGTVEIYAVDDAGTRSGPAIFTLNASAAAEFSASELVSGNATKGLTGGIGTVSGDARLEIDTELRIVPAAYVRAADGTLSAMHDTVLASAASDGGYEYLVPIFSPSTEMTQVSRLRLINAGDAAAAITIGAIDDSGAAATGGDVTLTLAAGGARTLTAQQLEAGDTDLTGQLGAGAGKWRLTVSSDRPLEVVNIVASTAGYWNNLSTTAVPGPAPADLGAFNERLAGRAVVYRSRDAVAMLVAAAGERFTETVASDGVTATHMGAYGYAGIGPDAGRMTLAYDGGEECVAHLYFASRTTGWFAAHCTGSDYPAEGTWLGGSWSIEDIEDEEDDGGDGTVMETTYGVDEALPGVPTSGFFIPAVTGGGSRVSASAAGTTISLDDGGYFELNDGTRYTCAATGGCTVVNGVVTAGTVTGRAAGTGEVDRFPSFRTADSPGNQSYTVGTPIDTLTLPEASGGNGALSYSLSPTVPGLTFNAGTRQLSGTPSTAGTYSMTYTVADEDGDTDSLSFSIDVEESDGGAGAAEGFGLDVEGGNGTAVGIVYANERLYVVDSTSDKVFAYSVSGQRDAAADFDLDDANVLPDGIAFANERFYVVDWYIQKVYGYTASGQRDAAADFDLDDESGSADGIAFANGRFFVVDRNDNKVYAYSASGQRDAAADFDLVADYAFSAGMDYAGERFYVVNSFRDKVYAYTETGQYDAAGDFDLHEDNDRPEGIAYGNDRFYVVDIASDRVYAYDGAPEPEDTSPGFATDAGPGDQTYTVDTAIDTLTLSQASGGNGTLSYSLLPTVPGLTFDAMTRQLTGTPSTAGSYNMTYTVADEDGDTDTLTFTITVEDPGGGDETTTYGVGDTLSDLPTGSWTPDVTSGGSFSSSGGNVTIRLNDGGYIEEGGYRFTCQNAGGCLIENRRVSSGTVARSSAGTAPGGDGEDSDDHGDDRASATRVDVGSDTPGSLSAGDVDYFRLNLDVSGTLEVYTSGGVDTVGQLEDSTGSPIDDNDDGGASTNFRIAEDVAEGTYYVRVRGFGSQTAGEYTLHVRFTGSDSGTTPPRTPAIQRLTDHNASDRFPLWSPDGQRIAFHSNRDGNWEVYVMDADGANPRQLTDNVASDAYPSWSPDGQRIAFHSNRDGNWEVYVMDADGANPRRLTHHDAGDESPSWSPDGQRIVFHSNRDGNWEVYVMDADGANPRRLTDHNANDRFPSWSPDGQRIAFHSNRDGNWEVYVMDADGANPRRLTDNVATDAFPSWSPDGQRIVFHSSRDGNWEVYAMDADGANPRRLTDHDASDGGPSWSPDGQRIVFSSNRDGNSEVYVMDADGDGTGQDPLPRFVSGSGLGDLTFTAGTAITALTLPAAGGGDGPRTYSLSPEVPGLTFNATAGVRELSGTPTTVGTYEMTYRVRDTDGDTDSLTFTITVTEPDPSDETGGGGDGCVEVNNVVELGEGESCTITQALVDKYGLNSVSVRVGDTATCSGGRVRLSFINAGSILLNGLTIRCR